MQVDICATRSWLDTLLHFHEVRAARCWRGALRLGRFYSWTEYSLYFVAAVESGALDQYHAFHRGGITDRKSTRLNSSHLA